MGDYNRNLIPAWPDMRRVLLGLYVLGWCVAEWWPSRLLPLIRTVRTSSDMSRHCIEIQTPVSSYGTILLRPWDVEAPLR